MSQNILVVLRLHERDRIRRICKREIQQLHLLRRIFLRDFSLQQLGEKLLPQQRQALLVYFFLPLPVGAEIVFFFQLCMQLGEQLLHFFKINRFEDIFRNAVANRPSGVLKVIPSGKEDDFNVHQRIVQNPRKLQAVQKRHLDVTDEQIRMQLLHIFQRFLSVARRGRNGKSQLFPRDASQHTMQDLRLIVC